MAVAVAIPLTLSPLVAAAGEPATAPTTTAATQSVDDGLALPPLAADSPIRGWLADLASPDAAARDAAATALMDLTRPQLAQLHRWLAASAPIAPAQAAALHDIVIQDFLASEPYRTNGGGFLGLLSKDVLGDEPARLGASVGQRVPGFPSFRLLRPGDLILGVMMNPDAPPTQQFNQPTQNFGQLKSAVSGAPAGHRVVLEVLRGGQRLRVSLRLAPYPLAREIGMDAMEQFFNERLQLAEAYWEREFLPLLRPGLS